MDWDDGFLLLGAGASRDGGVPTAQEFLGAIRTHLSGLGAPHAEAALAAFDEIVGQLTKSLGGSPGLEPFFEAIDDCLDAHYRGEPQPAGLQPSRAVERIHYETKRVIQEQCDVRDPGRASYLDPLMELLRGRRAFPIVSLNYDSLIELACARNGLEFFEPVIPEDPSRGTIKLIKVHGSVTWLPSAKGGGITRSAQYANAIMRRSGELRSAVLEMPLIYPSRKKMPIHAPFMRNSLELQNLFATKKFCVSVGYSFPDLHVRSWLEAAIQANPEFVLFVVGPTNGNPVFRNLVANLPNIRWTRCLRIVGRKFGEALKDGFESHLDNAPTFNSGMALRSEKGMVRARTRKIADGTMSGIGASPDGEVLYASDPAKSRVVRIDLESGAEAVFADRLKSPRGIAVTDAGDVLVIQNRLLRWSRIPTTGAGTVLRISRSGKRRDLTRFDFRSVLEIVRLLAKGTPWAELRDKFTSVQSWPTDVAVRRADGRIFATEARALVEVSADETPQRICIPPLAFNLHGLDGADDGALVGVEQGVGQTFSWGRVERFEPGSVMRVNSCLALEGQTRLMAICYIRGRNKVVVSQMLSWPLGALIMLDYPALDNARILRGFDFPQKLEFIPRRELLAIGTPNGVELLPMSGLNDAIPLEEGGLRMSFFLAQG